MPPAGCSGLGRRSRSRMTRCPGGRGLALACGLGVRRRGRGVGAPAPVGPTAAAARERGAGVVHLVVVAGEATRREEALEHLAEPNEETGPDQADDLPLPLR